ncbi:uroporphyrinogen-III synthase [Candidatus Chlamydia sanziniae]|uniref:Tetrapyrrole biosynthesis uroporphyrinogen III synthase domain-containing protein n=1 Tax=Candidatus Chlamydia sanziniae TaxID=1806891 RepID=A0A1A9HUD1_9CHLA|nr:uroporphyrinogen-III synthase [Candidatus Chlamydia sanziniae]ANH78317.1 hypothetical protein Cs308_0146 [Candidatus Chlamydia sanziniae]
MTLYLGLNRHTAQKYRAHFLPILTLVPYAQGTPFQKNAVRYFPQTTHVILTSPSSTTLFLSRMLRIVSKHFLNKKHYLCLGKATRQRLFSFLPKAQQSTAEQEVGEGLFPLIQALSTSSRILYPHSRLARPVIKDFLYQESKDFFAYPHYTVQPRHLKRSLFFPYEKIIFTSPSTVRAYAKIFPDLPHQTYWFQGPHTFQEFQTTYYSLTRPILNNTISVTKNALSFKILHFHQSSFEAQW